MTTLFDNNQQNQKKTALVKSGKRADHEGSIYFAKKRQEWVASVRVGINPKTGKPVRKYGYFKSQAEALAGLMTIKAKYAKITHIDADIITVGQWLGKWFMVYSLPKIRGNTAQSYRHILDIAVEELGGIKLDKLTDIDLQGVIFGRLKDHYRTAALFRLLMKRALRRAVKSKLIMDSPAEDLELPQKPRRRPFIRPSKEDWQRLINYPTSCLYCWKWIILTEFVTGARASEVLALRWQDFSVTTDEYGNIRSGNLHIQHALYLGQNEEKGAPRPVMLGNTKTAQGNRILPLPADFCRELMAYRKVQLERRLMTPGFDNQDFIFTMPDGSPINPGTFSSHYAFVRKKLGIKTTFHMLRHDMASRMKGTHMFDLKDIQAQLGHSSIQVTMDIYTHIDEEQNAKVSGWLAGGVNDLLGNNLPQEHRIG
ncbi:tyrosine-type recombinase/integrase [Selenomonas ruminantium]|uniref:Site-specific recombinase XerD n=1 Tax=Selenomonas ruminantium TaxID=971 RepID=A0A1K1MLJ1_SELRU|nr:site-specific integrase [Selenomonas ruminantium]SFW23969.1 Site-specific recombinase XerD [Selenomonas ruminantium]